VSSQAKPEKEFAFIEGESFNGAVARWAATAWVDRMLDLTRAAGVRSYLRHTAAGASAANIRWLAKEMEVDPQELHCRATPQVNGDNVTNGQRAFYGLLVPATMIEGLARRYAPAAFCLPNGEYHRALWDLRLFPVCIETGQPLQTRCHDPNCGNRRVGWQRPLGIATCEHCMADLSDAQVDAISPTLLNALKPVAGLFQPTMRSASLALLPPAITSDGGQLAVDLLIQLVPVINPALTHIRSGLHRTDPVQACEALVQAWDLMKGWPDRFQDFALTQVLSRGPGRGDGNRGRTVRFLKMKPQTTRSAALVGLATGVREAIDLLGPNAQAISSSTCSIKRAASMLGLGTQEVATLRRQQALRSRLVLSGYRLQPVFDRAELDQLAVGIAGRQGFASIASHLGISHHGVEQLADMKLIELHEHPFFLERYKMHQSTAASFMELERTLRDRQTDLSRASSITLAQAMKSVGGRLKPWGPVIAELLEKRIPYQIKTGPDSLVRRICIRVTDVASVSELTFNASAVRRFAFAKMMSKKDAMEALNIGPRQGTKLFAPVETEKGCRAKTVDIQWTLDLAARCISVAELAARRGVPARTAYCDAVRADMPWLCEAGFCRSATEARFLPQVLTR
jgi:hypothetical protein